MRNRLAMLILMLTVDTPYSLRTSLKILQTAYNKRSQVTMKHVCKVTNTIFIVKQSIYSFAGYKCSSAYSNEKYLLEPCPHPIGTSAYITNQHIFNHLRLKSKSQFSDTAKYWKTKYIIHYKLKEHSRQFIAPHAIKGKKTNFRLCKRYPTQFTRVQ